MAAAALIAGTVGSLLVWALTRVPGGGPTLGPAVAGALPQAGVGNPVTAVLLNIRGYDTLLEVGVLVLATLGVSVVGARTHAADFARPHVRGSLLDAFVHLTLPVLVMVAAYLLWVGADHPGGAFQGAAVLAGGWLVAALAGAAYDVPARTMTGVLTGGFGVYLAVAAAMLPLNGALLGFVPATAKWWLLLIESGLLLSCAAILATLVFRLVDDDPAGPRP
jgi:multisubunit Na+/H+ antiporter MnhB subunit